MSPPQIPDDLAVPLETVRRDLQAIFGPRLVALVAYGPRLRAAARSARGSVPPADTLALIDRVGLADLVACAARVEDWHRAGLRIPLLLGQDEFLRSLDAFPLEYDDILAHHVLLAGEDPFQGVAVRSDDLRRACETRAKGHLVHLREGYLEARGHPAGLAALIQASASPFAALVGNLARLDAPQDEAPSDPAEFVGRAVNVPAALVRRIRALEFEPALPAEDAAKLYPEYLALVERLVAWVDGWSRRS